VVGILGNELDGQIVGDRKFGWKEVLESSIAQQELHGVLVSFEH
jgi:hypothetical protein